MKNTKTLQIKIEREIRKLEAIARETKSKEITKLINDAIYLLDDVEHLLEEEQHKQTNNWEQLTKEQQRQLDKITFINY